MHIMYVQYMIYKQEVSCVLSVLRAFSMANALFPVQRAYHHNLFKATITDKKNNVKNANVFLAKRETPSALRNFKTLQELRMRSNVTLRCEITLI